jgi:flagellar biosynthesis/type III secretory pathway M-ring protein FliF/YscJ
MNGKDLINGLNFVEDKFVQEAEYGQLLREKKKINWKVWVAIAACFAIAAVIGTVNLINPYQESETPQISQNQATAVPDENLNIYYVSEDGTIESKSIEGGSEDLRESAAKEEDAVETENYLKLTLTVSSEFSEYAEGENGDMLIELLRRTFSDYSDFDEFNLAIDE